MYAKEIIFTAKSPRAKSPQYYEDKIIDVLKSSSTNTSYKGFSISDSTEWNGKSTNVILECSYHGCWNTGIADSISRGIGLLCKKCTGRESYTIESMTNAVNELIIKRNVPYTLNGITEFNGNYSYLTLSCSLHGEWSTTTFNNFKTHNNGCPGCAKNERYTPDNLELKINKIIKDINSPYVYKGWGGKWKGTNTKLILECSIHGEWDTCSISNFRKGHGCNKCQPGGYNTKLSGTLYLHKLEQDNEIFYKFGITNKTAEYRLKTIQRGSVFKHTLIESLTFNDGNKALNIENEIKQNIPHGVISKEQIKNGFSETVSSEYYNQLMEIFNRYKDTK